MPFASVGTVVINEIPASTAGFRQLRVMFKTEETGSQIGNAIARIPFPIDGTLIQAVSWTGYSGYTGNYSIYVYDRYDADMLQGRFVTVGPNGRWPKPINVEAGSYTWGVPVGGLHTFRAKRFGTPTVISGTFDLIWRASLVSIDSEHIET